MPVSLSWENLGGEGDGTLGRWTWGQWGWDGEETDIVEEICKWNFFQTIERKYVVEGTKYDQCSKVQQN